MARIISSYSAKSDDPIFKEGFVISSLNFSRGSPKSTETSQSDSAGPSEKASTQTSEEAADQRRHSTLDNQGTLRNGD